jgi:uncharacterized protein YbaR (Trm112 family)
MIKCPCCNNTFNVFDENTNECLVKFTLEMDRNFNGLYILDCPKCNNRLSLFPWEFHDNF